MPSAFVLNNGRPDISLIENIHPVERLLLIENNCPEDPSNERELSDNTLRVIGSLAGPINVIVGTIDVLTPPNMLEEKFTDPPTLSVPPIPTPPTTLRAPVVVLADPAADPIETDPPIPTPPAVTIEPNAADVEPVVDVMLSSPEALKLVIVLDAEFCSSNRFPVCEVLACTTNPLVDNENGLT